MGAGGQVGQELSRSARPDIQLVTLTRQELDIAEPGAVARCLEQEQPALVINAAAYTAVDAAETDATAAWRANAEGPALLAGACSELGCRLVHISTDFVFDGKSTQPYRPGDETAPLGEYGRGKLAGEEAIQQGLPGAVIMRTGWVYSSFGSNFVKTMLRLMAEREAISVVADQVGTPTWAAGLAGALWQVAARPQLEGIYHWSDAGVCSWYDFAVAICEEGLHLGLLKKSVQINPIATSEYPTAAARPPYSVLDKKDSWRELELGGVHWRQQLRAMLKDMKELNNA
jgi:dTDP-4-dehydrorhamnose reductase